VAYSVKDGGDGGRKLVQKTLGEGLALPADGSTYCIFRDHITGLEYIRNSREVCEKGLYIELEAYKCHVFLDWRLVQDNEWGQYAHLTTYLNGRGVPSIEEALQEVFLQPVHQPFRELVNADLFRQLVRARITKPDGKLDRELLVDVEGRTLRLLREIRQFTGTDEVDSGSVDATALEIGKKLEACLQLPTLDSRFPQSLSQDFQAAVETLRAHLGDDLAVWGTLFAWLFTHALGKVVDDMDATDQDPGQHDSGAEQQGQEPGHQDPSYAAQSRSWMDEWLLGKLVAGTLRDLGLQEEAAWRATGLVKILIEHPRWCEVEAPSEQRVHQILVNWLKDSEVQQFVQVNRYGGILWFNHEAFDELLAWMLILSAVEISADPEPPADEVVQEIVACYDVVRNLQRAEEASEYQVVKLMELAKG
jgi:hypothetical protein